MTFQEGRPIDEWLPRAIWIAAHQLNATDPAGGMDPDEMADRIRDLLRLHPPAIVDGVQDLEPFVRIVAAEFGLNADQLVADCRASVLGGRAERAAAVQAAEELLRGNSEA